MTSLPSICSCGGWCLSSRWRAATSRRRQRDSRRRSRSQLSVLQASVLRCRPPLALRAPVTDPRALRVVVLALHRLRDPRATSAAWFPAALEHPVVLALARASRRGLLPVHLVRLQQPVGAEIGRASCRERV